MYISAFLHRDELFEITNRWLSDKLEPDDPLRVTRIMSYDSFVAWEQLLQFVSELNKSFASGKIRKKPLTIKKELKDFICTSNSAKSDRIKHLIDEYTKLPEYHYVGSPLSGYIYHDNSNHIISMCRFKRVKRIAEKASRYASIYVSKEVQKTADNIYLAEDHKLKEIPAIPDDILARAERKQLLHIKESGITLPKDIMTIKDVLGVKVIQNGVSESKLETIIEQIPEACIVEKEYHSGHYNAIHYIIELKVDIDKMIQSFSTIENKTVFSNKGLPMERLLKDFDAFIGTGADTVQVDLIFTSFDELVESEIGRSMHESRIFKQRQHQNSFGNITINIEYIIEYLLAVGLSPTVSIDDIPIKIWGRYLPDSLSYRIRSLYEMPEYAIVDP
jgi:hypothetical protein